MPTPRTNVEIVDPCGTDGHLIKPREIHINGTPVLVEAGSFNIEHDDPNEVVRVHLTILPDTVTFRRGPRS